MYNLRTTVKAKPVHTKLPTRPVSYASCTRSCEHSLVLLVLVDLSLELVFNFVDLFYRLVYKLLLSFRGIYTRLLVNRLTLRVYFVEILEI